jgi:hypothetical protein
MQGPFSLWQLSQWLVNKYLYDTLEVMYLLSTSVIFSDDNFVYKYVIKRESTNQSHFYSSLLNYKRDIRSLFF